MQLVQLLLRKTPVLSESLLLLLHLLDQNWDPASVLLGLLLLTMPDSLLSGNSVQEVANEQQDKADEEGYLLPGEPALESRGDVHKCAGVFRR